MEAESMPVQAIPYDSYEPYMVECSMCPNRFEEHTKGSICIDGDIYFCPSCAEEKAHEMFCRLADGKRAFSEKDYLFYQEFGINNIEVVPDETR